MKTINAYVLKVTPLKSNDVIITLLTEEGIKDVYGRGYNGIKNKFHILVNTGIKVNITGVDKKNYFQVYDVDLLTINEFITKDYDLFIKYTDIIKLILQTKAMHDKTSFMLFEYTVDNLEKLPVNLLIDLWCIYFLKRENIIFKFDECIKCASKDNIITLSFIHGGLICQNCYIDEKILDIQTIKDIKALYDGRITYLIENGYSIYASKFIKEALEYYSGIKI